LGFDLTELLDDDSVRGAATLLPASPHKRFARRATHHQFVR